MSTQVTRVLVDGFDNGGAPQQRLCAAHMPSNFSNHLLWHARPFRPSGADGASRWRRVAPRRVPFPHARTPRATRRLLLVALPPHLDGPARSVASPAAPRADRSGLSHGGPAEAPNSDRAAVAFISPGGQVLTPTSTCPPGSKAHQSPGDVP